LPKRERNLTQIQFAGVEEKALSLQNNFRDEAVAL